MNAMIDQGQRGWELSLEAVGTKLEAMRGGNGSAAAVRDLSLTRGPYWSTRRVPAHPHHFTRTEFEAYLLEERFPVNTLADRIAEHVQVIRRALVKGEGVPSEVMLDDAGREALDLAEMDVHASAEGMRRLAQQQEAVLMFERAIGKHSPDGRPATAVHGLLMAAARADLERPVRSVDFGLYAWVAGGYKRVRLEGHPREILIGVRQGNGQKRWLEFRDAGWPVASLYGDVQRMSYIEADGIYGQAVAQGNLTLKQAVSVMGSDWRPFLTVQVCESAASV